MDLNELYIGSTKALTDVHPELRLRVMMLIKLLHANQLYFGAFMGMRTIGEQEALFAQGRTIPGKIVTQARGGQSWHNFGLAVDMVEDGDPTRAGIQWSWANNKDYLRIGMFAQMCGLEWGGFWKSFKDYPHVQLTFGMTLAEANQKFGDGGIMEVWDDISRRI